MQSHSTTRIPLKTIEDFEVAAKGLSKENFWVGDGVRIFGFCWFCLEITEYDFESGREKEGFLITCLKCGRKFGSFRGKKYLPDEMYWINGIYDPGIPGWVEEKIKLLESQEVQLQFLLDQLDRFITKRRLAARRAQGDVKHALAIKSKLRGGKSSTLTKKKAGK